MSGQITGDVNAPIAERRVAGEILERAGGVVVDKGAVGIKVERRGGGKLSAVDAFSAEPGLDLGGIGSSIEVQFAREVAAPARICAEQQAGELAELGFTPFEIQMDGHLA